MLSVLNVQSMYHQPISHLSHLSTSNNLLSRHCNRPVYEPRSTSRFSFGHTSAVDRPDRLLTPPSEMSSLAPSLAPQPIQEYGYLSNERPIMGSKRSEYGAQGSMPEYRRQNSFDTSTYMTKRPSSPVPSQPVFTSSSSQGRHPSDASAIAPALQIPRTVNSSQGSLAELAAQITCLFWFESATSLDIAENMTTMNGFVPTISPDAIPSTGFRKWVITILSTTQVAQNVILLALLFIYRLKKLNPTVRGKLGSEYRLLTVALMLGNKFLDDNTYTNKTWAEVSGISVMEIHIMEVEFLSNMKYNLFTSAEEWRHWQSLLGRFAGFVERAARSPNMASLAASPARSYASPNLPSPPVSFQASPPDSSGDLRNNLQYAQIAMTASRNTTPRPPSLGPVMNPALATSSQKRKRSSEDASAVLAAKRQALASPAYREHRHTNSAGSAAGYWSHQSQGHSQGLARPGQPSASMPHVTQAVPPSQPLPTYQQQSSMQLPPINYPISRTPMSLPSTAPPSTWSQPSSLAGALQQTHYSSHSVASSRHASPYPPSNNVSPTNTSLLPMQPQYQPSPSVILGNRNSPYRPVRSVNTLLVPPPVRAMHQPENVEYNQMHYQPLGRPIEERQQGKLPYIAQNQWFDGSHQKITTPIEQWPAWNPFQNQHHLPPPPPSYR